MKFIFDQAINMNTFSPGGRNIGKIFLSIKWKKSGCHFDDHEYTWQGNYLMMEEIIKCNIQLPVISTDTHKW